MIQHCSHELLPSPQDTGYLPYRPLATSIYDSLLHRVQRLPVRPDFKEGNPCTFQFVFNVAASTSASYSAIHGQRLTKALASSQWLTGVSRLPALILDLALAYHNTARPSRCPDSDCEDTSRLADTHPSNRAYSPADMMQQRLPI